MQLVVRGLRGRSLDLLHRLRLGRQGRDLVVQPRPPGGLQLGGHLVRQAAGDDRCVVGKRVRDDRRARGARDDGDDVPPALATGGAVAPTRGLVGPARREGREHLHQDVARQRVRHAHVHRPGQDVVAAQHRAAVLADGRAEGDGVAPLLQVGERPEHGLRRVHVEDPDRRVLDPHGLRRRDAVERVAQHRLAPDRRRGPGGGGQDHRLAPAGRHDAPDGGHAQREGEVERHGAGDAAVLERGLQSRGDVRLAVRGLDPLQLLEPGGARADHNGRDVSVGLPGQPRPAGQLLGPQLASGGHQADLHLGAAASGRFDDLGQGGPDYLPDCVRHELRPLSSTSRRFRRAPPGSGTSRPPC